MMAPETGETIVLLHELAGGIRADALARARGLSSGGRAVVESLTAQVVDALLERPTQALLETPGARQASPYEGAVRHLFGLEARLG